MMGIILLTGANGFLATHILAQLLGANKHVIAAVRSLQAEEELELLFGKNALMRVEIVLDYTDREAFQSILKSNPGIVSVIHTPSFFKDSANPYAIPEKHPAIQSTTGLLKAIKSYGENVKNVVITSSSAAVINYSYTAPGKIYTEEDWNPITWEEAQKGGLSKMYKASKKYMEIAGMLCIYGRVLVFADLVTSIRLHGRPSSIVRTCGAVSSCYLWSTSR